MKKKEKLRASDEEENLEMAERLVCVASSKRAVNVADCYYNPCDYNDNCVTATLRAYLTYLTVPLK